MAPFFVQYRYHIAFFQRVRERFGREVFSHGRVKFYLSAHSFFMVLN